MMQVAIFMDLLIGSMVGGLVLFCNLCPEQSLKQRGGDEHENCIHSESERRRW